MAINYRKKNWIEGQTFDPDTMNYLDGGIQQACDGVDALANVPTDLARNGYGEQSGGKNLADLPNISNTSGGYLYEYKKIYLASGTYTLSHLFSGSGSTNRIRLYSRDKQEIYTTTYNVSNANTAIVTFTINEECHYISLYANAVGTYSNIQIEQGNSATSYEPYYESNKMLTDDTAEIASLKFLGWTVPREYSGPRNYVDSEGKFHQRVARVDLGSLNWAKSEATGGMYATSPAYRFAANVSAYCSKYAFGGVTVSTSQVANGTFALYYGSGVQQPSYEIYVKDSSYTSAANFKSAMSGTYLYYELATEVVIAEGNEKVFQINGADAGGNTVKDVINAMLNKVSGKETGTYQFTGSWPYHSSGYAGTITKAFYSGTERYYGSIYEAAGNYYAFQIVGGVIKCTNAIAMSNL